MKLERRHFQLPIQLRAATDATEKGNIISGYAAVFFDPANADTTQFRLWKNCYERIMPGAFDEALKRPDDVRGLFNHNPDNILGRSLSETLKLTVDKRGLYFEITLPDTPIAQTVRTAIERKDVTGCSFAFDCDVQTWMEDNTDPNLCVCYREIRSVTLYDVGPVTFPAYEGTDCDLERARRSLDDYLATKPYDRRQALRRYFQLV